MTHDSRMARFIRGLVKFVFIACYIAFMWASIHHVATYFNSFEANSGDIAGSYMLAGAFDITALVTTIGVMFFRKSMPGPIQVLVWVFILAIAGYSFFINWEYAAHFQNTSLVLQPTGDTTPVYDAAGVLHYVPVMRQNTALLLVNPFLASGFTIFSLVYSVVAEFFGTKPPTVEELTAKQKYLEETATIKESIKKLEGTHQGKSFIQATKEKALELKDAVKEVAKKNSTEQDTEHQTERNTDKLRAITGEENTEETAKKTPAKKETSTERQAQNYELSDEANMLASYYVNSLSWLTTSSTTVPLRTIAETMNLNMKMLRNRVESKDIRATKNKEIVYKDSVITWALVELLPKETAKIVHLKPVQAMPETEQDAAPEIEQEVPEHEMATV